MHTTSARANTTGLRSRASASSSAPLQATSRGCGIPRDELFVPFYRSNGEVLGILSLGDPRSGLRPSDDEFFDVLVAMAEHTAIAVEGLQLANAERPPLAQVQTG